MVGHEQELPVASYSGTFAALGAVVFGVGLLLISLLRQFLIGLGFGEF